MQAYDLNMLKRSADRGSPDDHGWCFGLPPGIAPEQWPLDPVSGYPLVHGFTLLLPEDYRVHGPDIVGLSFFATAFDQNDGGAFEPAGLPDAVLAESAEPPSDPGLLPFWEIGRRRHRRLHRMTDILDYAYALVLLTREEFEGPLCRPPGPIAAEGLRRPPPPDWLAMGAAAAYWQATYSPSLGLPPDDHHIVKQLGCVPDRDVTFHRALRWTPRVLDPNAGKAPREAWSAEETGYQQPFYWLDGRIETDAYREHDWVAGHAADHIGGTMRPVQNIPEFSPYYVEFSEEFGGYNFGSGNAQLDFKDMKFDWACG